MFESNEYGYVVVLSRDGRDKAVLCAEHPSTHAHMCGGEVELRTDMNRLHCKVFVPETNDPLHWDFDSDGKIISQSFALPGAKPNSVQNLVDRSRIALNGRL